MVFSNTIKLNMKNKKIKIVFCIAILLIILGCIVYFGFIRKSNSRNTEIYQNQPDMVIKSTKEKPMESEGFEVTNIDIFKTTKTSLELKATIVNKSNVLVNGFFVEIGFFNEKDELITEIAKNYTEDIKSGETYVLDASIVGLKDTSDIASAKILNIEKEISANIQEEFNKEIESSKPQ